MKFLALISGGKDSFYNIHHCITQGHDLIALGNLYPKNTQQDEIDSFMFQTVGHDIIDNYAKCLDVPLYRQAIEGRSKNQELEYSRTEDDEIEDLFKLITTIVKNHPDVQAISCGAILSHYQRTRVENICDRFGLTSLAFLWQRNQDQLMREMCDSRLDARIIKVAAIGLDAKHLAKSIKELYPYLVKLNKMYDVHICGEGGEFETIVLDCVFFKHKKLNMIDMRVVQHSSDVFYLKFGIEVVDKKEEARIPFASAIVPSLLENSFQEVLENSVISEEFYPAVSSNSTPYQLSSKVCSVGNNIFISNLVDSSNTIQEQLSNIFIRLEEFLKDANLSLNDIQHITLLLADMDKFSEINGIYSSKFIDLYLPPSRICIETSLPDPYQVQLSCRCIIKETNTKKGIHIRSRSYWAPQNIGPYSQARVEEQKDFNFATISGQIPLIPSSMELLSSGNETIALTIQHFDRIRALINVQEISTILCFVTHELNLDSLKQIWHTYCQTDSHQSLLEKLIILNVSRLPRNASIEFGGETFKSVEDLLEEDEEIEKTDHNDLIIWIKETFPDLILTQLKDSVSVSIFTDSATDLNKLMNDLNGFIRVYCSGEDFKKLDNFGEFMPVSQVMNFQMRNYKYAVSVIVKR
ncbi:diphthamide synthase [Yamadazyma tenuis]|uniref:Diphthine--ammonia ligase n=1 Tax=Candida tenuis (strain ATCC 10573 / BCRC 21748 / CBS 615 / JCM 9827 / NBRC 10315 / NRRL Y-1498 / VKM Y-70) TaxID=590646 RepID=G3B1J9_CANTC|nr:uncharacterized protein CANTEDRAFT_92694 [Yamadazyma tenuis ATCC 10573]EGV64464.1 hypothetical protein CANTEDRAFT_92694 [Yamadazyma tenuis ATCC 10573]WEJ97224.1 diphthamide synthase [Yamadazyma tenuis]